jgi:hypothetical protein
VLGARTFVLSDGKWIDTAFDPDTMTTKTIDFLSQGYFDLVAAHPELADAFALGEQVIALSDGVAYEVLPGEIIAQPVNPTATPTPISSDTPIITPTQTPTQDTPKPSTGPCAAGVLPIAFIPLFVLLVKKPRRIK